MASRFLAGEPALRLTPGTGGAVLQIGSEELPVALNDLQGVAARPGRLWESAGWEWLPGRLGGLRRGQTEALRGAATGRLANDRTGGAA